MPSLQYMKASNNYYVYVPRRIVTELKLSPGDELKLIEWIAAEKNIQKEKHKKTTV